MSLNDAFGSSSGKSSPSSLYGESLSYGANSPITQPELNAIIKSGLLRKEGGVVRNWKVRLFKLTNSALYYYDISGKEIKGKITIQPDATVVDENVKDKGKHVFSILTSKRTYYLSAKDEDDKISWCEAIRALVLRASVVHQLNSYGAALDRQFKHKTIQNISPISDVIDEESNKDLNSVEDDKIIEEICLSVEEEYDLAMSAVEIFLKEESERLPEEQAYVIAMKQYRQQLQDYCNSIGAEPEYSIASGTSIFVMDQSKMSATEKEFVHDITREYTNELKTTFEEYDVSLELQEESSKASAAILAKDPCERTAEENLYVLKVEACIKKVIDLEHQLNLEVRHPIISHALTLAKYPEERTFQEEQYVQTVLTDLR
ncbi:ArhGAP [Acrasis kona]|uniref:ArhGAP n=1 Tax=Acrasis kona TaxID=1008807 RepID=A0AAW2ZPK3_9EUKA